jgi:hypothetical protein
MHKSLVSVVMVVCDVERFLSESIESMLNQTFRDYEFIILDFGSRDKSKAIVSTYAVHDHRIRMHEIPACSLVEARIAACSLAEGSYLAIMDADDISLSDRLLHEVEFMECHPEVGVLGGAAEWIDAARRPLWTLHVPQADQEIKRELASRCPFTHSAVLIRKDAFDAVNGYRRVFSRSHDYDLWLRLAERWVFANLEQVVVQYRIHAHQASLRERKQQTLCKLAAQVSSAFRRRGETDPLDSLAEITPQALEAWGVGARAQQRELAADCRTWLYNLSAAGEHSAALKVASEILKSPETRYLDSRTLSDLYLFEARLQWKRENAWKSVLAAGHAFLARPVILGRPLKSLVRRLGLA